MEEKLYTGQIAIEQLGELIASCQFPEDNHTWVLAEQIPNHAIDRQKIREERQNMLRYAYFRANIPFANYSSGRVFREDRELRWEKLENPMSVEKLKNIMRVVYLGTDKYISALQTYNLQENKCVLKATRTETKSYYLFGERLKEEDLKYMRKAATQEIKHDQPPTTKDFAQVRIPHILRYPVRHSLEPYVRLKVREYINTETGIVELFRFLNLAPEEKEEKEEKQHESI